jgi:2-polyprenyl-3-methyl-5-hydroxy-6-metoxy-1,4-benzoquinol methylase
MESTATSAPGTDQATDPHGLDEMRAQIAAGTKMTGSFALRFLRAVHAEDPLATEESLASLPGNRGVHLYDSLVAWSPIRAGERVLDIGCGSGGATRSAARAVGDEGRVIGVDVNQHCLDVARERTPGDLGVQYRRGDARSLSFIDDRSQDCVIASMMLDEVEDIRPVLD